MILNFYLRFSTALGQSLYVSGSHTAMGADDVTKALPLQYFNNEFWQGQVELPEESLTPIDLQYRYILKTQDGNQVIEWGDDRVIEITKNQVKEYTLIDTWNHAGDVAPGPGGARADHSGTPALSARQRALLTA